MRVHVRPKCSLIPPRQSCCRFAMTRARLAATSLLGNAGTTRTFECGRTYPYVFISFRVFKPLCRLQKPYANVRHALSQHNDLSNFFFPDARDVSFYASKIVHDWFRNVSPQRFYDRLVSLVRRLLIGKIENREPIITIETQTKAEIFIFKNENRKRPKPYADRANKV